MNNEINKILGSILDTNAGAVLLGDKLIELSPNSATVFSGQITIAENVSSETFHEIIDEVFPNLMKSQPLFVAPTIKLNNDTMVTSLHLAISGKTAITKLRVNSTMQAEAFGAFYFYPDVHRMTFELTYTLIA